MTRELISPIVRQVHIHDCKIQNFDDSIAIKPCNTGRCTFSNCSEHILVERLEATGVGLSIGSVRYAYIVHAKKGGEIFVSLALEKKHIFFSDPLLLQVSPSTDVNCVRNITMRDITMPDTIKGIYIKTDPGTSGSGIVSDVIYEK